MMPVLQTEVPGPRSRDLARKLREYESQNVTYVSEDWPVFWERADGYNIWDVDGNRFVDLTSAFGVAGLGHTRAEVIQAMHEQSRHLIHGMGDVHPTEVKAQLCEKLSKITWGRWSDSRAKVVLANSGFEAVETALKTALLHTGQEQVLSFQNAYHGLGYGALMSSGIEKFRAPFAGHLADVRITLPYPKSSLDEFRAGLESLSPEKIGACLVEPIQGRGGKIVPPNGFLKLLREWCDQHGILLIFDEIYTGFNRTGHLFACEHEGVIPDLICMGKAMSGGFPISATVGAAEVMDSWPESPGEALHTSTFLGNPVGCAMALKAIDLHLDPQVAKNVERLGEWLMRELRESSFFNEVRGRGLMIGAELRDGISGGAVLNALLKRGYLMLADGPEGNVLAFTPPFTITKGELTRLLEVLDEVLTELA